MLCYVKFLYTSESLYTSISVNRSSKQTTYWCFNIPKQHNTRKFELLNMSVFVSLLGGAADRRKSRSVFPIPKAPRVSACRSQAALQRGCDQRHRTRDTPSAIHPELRAWPEPQPEPQLDTKRPTGSDIINICFHHAVISFTCLCLLVLSCTFYSYTQIRLCCTTCLNALGTFCRLLV